MTVEEQILHTLPQAVSDLYQAEMPVAFESRKAHRVQVAQVESFLHSQAA